MHTTGSYLELSSSKNNNKADLTIPLSTPENETKLSTAMTRY